MVDSSFIQILLYHCINWSVNTSKKVKGKQQKFHFEFVFFIEEFCDFPPVHTDEAPCLPYLLLVFAGLDVL